LTRKKPLITPQIVHLLKIGGTTAPEEVLKSRNDLGYESASIDEMIDDCYHWMLREGLIGRQRRVGRSLVRADAGQPSGPRPAIVPQGTTASAV
jgi:hypothetical protein